MIEVVETTHAEYTRSLASMASNRSNALFGSQEYEHAMAFYNELLNSSVRRVRLMNCTELVIGPGMTFLQSWALDNFLRAGKQCKMLLYGPAPRKRGLSELRDLLRMYPNLLIRELSHSSNYSDRTVEALKGILPIEQEVYSYALGDMSQYRLSFSDERPAIACFNDPQIVDPLTKLFDGIYHDSPFWSP